jgi:hypothetical protein
MEFLPIELVNKIAYFALEHPCAKMIKDEFGNPNRRQRRGCEVCRRMHPGIMLELYECRNYQGDYKRHSIIGFIKYNRRNTFKINFWICYDCHFRITQKQDSFFKVLIENNYRLFRLRRQLMISHPYLSSHTSK